ncbi:oleate hydratase [Dubosiella newyorkensis]|uniref:oleate hydratase n=1 Tax=Dubosiella newyorkensis TaxID=1862672 RepID=UPI003F6714F2
MTKLWKAGSNSAWIRKIELVSATVNPRWMTSIIPLIEKITKRAPLTGHVVTGESFRVQIRIWASFVRSIVSAIIDDQPKGQVSFMVCMVCSSGLSSWQLVKNRCGSCTGKEIVKEWLYHLGVLRSRSREMAEKSANTVAFIDAFCERPYFQQEKMSDVHMSFSLKVSKQLSRLLELCRTR